MKWAKKPSPESNDCFSMWCERGDSNPHGFPRQILSLVRLPIPPLSHLGNQIIYGLLSSGSSPSGVDVTRESLRPGRKSYFGLEAEG